MAIAKDNSNGDGLNGWDGNQTNRNNSYIEYGGEKRGMPTIMHPKLPTETRGLLDCLTCLNVRGNTQKNITPLDLVWS